MSPSNIQLSYSALIDQLQLPDSFHEIISTIYRPLSQLILDRKQHQPLLISINGAQGTGKSTMTTFLKRILESEMNCHVADLSLDDFYSVREKRMALAESVHPLFTTRGVPGTHDVELIEHVLEQLINRQPCRVPRFNKAIDDRRDESEWTDFKQPVDIILFEGWCNNSPAQDQQALLQPVNALEKNEDPQGIWRQHVNAQLIDYNKRIFDHADMCIMLKAPDFESIFGWRGLQEKKLKSASAQSKHHSVMTESELRCFIQHFERISRHTLAQLPETADVVLPVSADHTISSIVTNPATRQDNR